MSSVERPAPSLSAQFPKDERQTIVSRSAVDEDGGDFDGLLDIPSELERVRLSLVAWTRWHAARGVELVPLGAETGEDLQVVAEGDGVVYERLSAVTPPPDRRIAATTSLGAGERHPTAEPIAIAETQDPRTWSTERKLSHLLRRNIGDCRRCGLCEGRSNIVFARGSAHARVFFVGEAPGANEDRTGEPFVGAAGKRLDLWIEACGWRRDEVYIANLLKCRPPENRDPLPEELAKCEPFLRAQIRAIRPAVLVGLGRFASSWLLALDPTTKMSDMRLRAGHYHDPSDAEAARIPVIATYHPAYVIRTEGDATRSETPDSGGGRSQINRLVLEDLRQAVPHLESERNAATT